MNPDGMDYVYEGDEWEDGESEDGMVFRYMPREYKRAQLSFMDLISHILLYISAGLEEYRDPAVIASEQAAHRGESRDDEEDEETFYYDEETGAVYDSEGRRVDLQPQVDNGPRRLSRRLISRGRPSEPLSPVTEEARGSIIEPGRSTSDIPRSATVLSEILAEMNLPPTDGRPHLHQRSDSTATIVASPPATVPPHGLTIDLSPFSYNAELAQSSETMNQMHIVPALPFDSDSKEASPVSTHVDAFSAEGFESLFALKAPYKGCTFKDYQASRTGRGPAPLEIGSRGLRFVRMEVQDEDDTDSPFPEVRAAVSNVDDPEMPVNTFRLWFIGLIMCTICGAANTFFSFRYPAPQVAPLVLLLVVYPLGKLLAAVLPERKLRVPQWLGGGTLSLNSGFFNIKEHAAIAQMANVAIGQAYAINAVVVQDSPLFYSASQPIGFAVLFTLTTICFAFGLAGVCRRYLVWPASMIWPQNLVVSTILHTLHAEEDPKDGKVSRFRYFSIVACAAFVWNFVPTFLFTALSSFNWVCWIAPTNIVVNTLFGASNGLGLSVLTFDWQQISYVGSPMITPWWAVCNIMIGFTVLVLIAFPALYFSNTWNFGYFPILGSTAYDRFGKRYQIPAVLDPSTFTLDKDQYEAYSPLYIPVNYFIVYWAGLAMASAMLVHTALYYGPTLWKGLFSKQVEQEDIHARLMRKYNELSEWWYAALVLIGFVGAVIAVEMYDIGLPVWALLLALLLPIVYILPAGFIFASTGQILNINLVTQLISGYVLPAGRSRTWSSKRTHSQASTAGSHSCSHSSSGIT